MSDCAFLARGGVDLHALDLSPAGQDLRDTRIKSSVVIDPGIVETLTANSLKQIDIPVLVINLGDTPTIPMGVYAQPAAALIPNADYVIVEDSIHFSFLAECKPKGPVILQREGEPDPLCSDAGGQERGAIHAKMKVIIIDYLRRVL
jgi:predicted dienelactone hydrolase